MFFRILIYFLVFVSLTVLTQVGGIVLLIWSLALGMVNLKKIGDWKIRGIKVAGFLLMYLIVAMAVVPLLSRPFGREPLPVFGNENLMPLNIMTCILNRHYVSSELLSTTEEVATELQKKFPGSTLSYLDANFPFFDGFPLIPHLSHNDGQKLDLAFFYTDVKTGQFRNRTAPSFIGYGVFTNPNPGETDMPGICKQKGHWQYGFLEKIIPQNRKNDFELDNIRTKYLVDLFTERPTIKKIFIEPHLKQRLDLKSTKVRFHGCQAVRHDDHIHIQM